MEIIATARIEGQEAVGSATIFSNKEGNYTLRLTDFWVAQGAPDVKIVFSEDPNGIINNNTICYIADMPSGNFNQDFPIDHLKDFYKMKTLIVYCKQFFVHFGHGTINRV